MDMPIWIYHLAVVVAYVYAAAPQIPTRVITINCTLLTLPIITEAGMWFCMPKPSTRSTKPACVLCVSVTVMDVIASNIHRVSWLEIVIPFGLSVVSLVLYTPLYIYMLYANTLDIIESLYPPNAAPAIAAATATAKDARSDSSDEEDSEEDPGTPAVAFETLTPPSGCVS